MTMPQSGFSAREDVSNRLFSRIFHIKTPFRHRNGVILILEPPPRFELGTYGLQNRCSAVELGRLFYFSESFVLLLSGLFCGPFLNSRISPQNSEFLLPPFPDWEDAPLPFLIAIRFP